MLCWSYVSVAQGAFTKAAKGNDYIVVVNDGIQFSVGANVSNTRSRQKRCARFTNRSKRILFHKPFWPLGLFCRVGICTLFQNGRGFQSSF